jgi:hypothetical protein
MSRSQIIFLTAIAACAGIGSFLATRAIGQSAADVPAAQPLCQAAAKASKAQAGKSPLASWLRVTPGQARALEQGEFSEEAASLNKTLEDERAKLISLFETPGTSDEQLLQQVEQVIVAHDALERHVARYVVGLRNSLTPQQQRRLMGLCAASMRGAGCCQGQCQCAINRAKTGCGLCPAAQQGKASGSVPPCRQQQ